MRLDTGNLIEDLERWKQAYLANIKGLSYSANTIALYRRAIDTFIEYSRAYQDEIGMRNIGRMFITNFLSYLDDEHKRRHPGKTLSSSTKNTYLKALRAFFIFISDNNDEFFTYENFFKKLRVTGLEKSEEKLSYLTEEEIQRLLDVLEKEEENTKSGYLTYRNALFIKLLYFAGLRTSEALAIRKRDIVAINDGYYKIRIKAKGGKIQYAYIPMDAISKEIDFILNNIDFQENDLLIRTTKETPLDRHAAYRIAKRLFRKAGIFHKSGLHILRHSLAMRLVKQKVDPIRIQKVLRHASITSTMVYAKADEKDVLEALDYIR